MDKAPSPLSPIAPKMLAETVVEAIVEAAAKGHFLPGDRIVEADVARQLQVSRVPVREALRLLESQGIVENTPYRGMRLMQVTPETMKGLHKVRLALELLAANEIQHRAKQSPSILAPLEALTEDLKDLSAKGDTFGFSKLDMEFHRQMIRMADNPALLKAWEPLARQLMIVIGLSTSVQSELDFVVKEHTVLVAALRSGTPEDLKKIMEEHILEVPYAVNYKMLREKEKLRRKRVD